MELIGVLVLSISMALFGVYQMVPLTNIRPDMVLPMRLRGGFPLGYIFGRIGDTVQIAPPQEEADTALSTSMPVLDRAISTPVPISTCCLEQLILETVRN